MVKVEGLIGQNITVVYERLDLTLVDTSKLRRLGDIAVRPTIMETPEMIVAVFPSHPIIVQIGDQRIRFTIPRTANAAPLNVLPEILHKSIRSVTPKQSKVIAYGFNFDLLVSLTEKTAFELLNEKFVSDQAHLNSKLGGELLYIAPRISFTRKNVRYEIFFEVSHPYQIVVHLNAHIDLEGRSVPPLKLLKSEFESEYKIAEEVSVSLLNEGKS